MKIQIVNLFSAENIIKKTKEHLHCKSTTKGAFNYVMKHFFYNDYDINFLFPRLEPYILGKKKNEDLEKEIFIKKNSNSTNSIDYDKMKADVERAGGYEKLHWMD